MVEPFLWKVQVAYPRLVYLLEERRLEQLELARGVVPLPTVVVHPQVALLPLRDGLRQWPEHDRASPHLRVPVRLLLPVLPPVILVDAPLGLRHRLKT